MNKKIVVILGVLPLILSVFSIAQAKDDSIIATRANFKTKLVRKINDNDQIEPVPPELFSIVKYETPMGDMSAYLSKGDGSKKKQAAIIWITGGFPAGGADGSAWQNMSPSNDQSAKIYRQMGMVMMYPFLRGSGGNPGFHEGFLGEVDDVINALKYLQKVDYVDPKRIYLGGHSTGGTLALIVAALTHDFKAVFAFGPVSDPRVYGENNVLHDTANEMEYKVRAPINYLPFIKTPTYVFEGSKGNIDSLKQMSQVNKNKNVTFIPINGANHFETLAPINALIAQQITQTKNSTLELNVARVQSSYDDFHVSMLEANDLQLMADIRRSGIPFNKPRLVHYYFLARKNEPLAASVKELKKLGFDTSDIQSRTDNKQQTFYLLVANKKVNLLDLKSVFATSAQATKVGDKFQTHYDGWGIN